MFLGMALCLPAEAGWASLQRWYRQPKASDQPLTVPLLESGAGSSSEEEGSAFATVEALSAPAGKADSRHYGYVLIPCVFDLCATVLMSVGGSAVCLPAPLYYSVPCNAANFPLRTVGEHLLLHFQPFPACSPMLRFMPHPALISLARRSQTHPCPAAGLLYVTISVFQMLRGVEVVFSALFTILFLGRPLNGHHLGGIFVCLVSGEACVCRRCFPSKILDGDMAHSFCLQLRGWIRA